LTSISWFVPAFQREYVWDREDTEQLIDSLLKQYPTGTMLTWETANPPELRVDKLEKEVREAKQYYDNNDEEAYRNRAFQIYNGLRSTWERAIEDIAFNGVVVRHRDYVDTKKLRKATVLSDADCDAFEAGFKKVLRSDRCP
jgi:hypothetical protein